jgi:tripartite-type tricarboxylate transporter receptor subunit TctC
MTQDVASGVNQVMMSSIAAANAVVQAGKVRRIAITAGKPYPGLIELPPISNTVPGVVINGLFAVVAPAGTPGDIIARLNREIGEYLKGAEINERLRSFGFATEGAGSPESTGQLIRQEQELWRALAKELQIEPQ